MVVSTRLPSLFSFPEIFSAPFTAAASASGPALDVWSEDEDLVVAVELPGVDPDTIEVTLERGVLRLKGERKPLDESKRVLHRERVTGPFSRTLRLPHRVDPDKVETTWANGVLEVRLPRADEDRPRRIEVKSAG